MIIVIWHSKRIFAALLHLTAGALVFCAVGHAQEPELTPVLPDTVIPGELLNPAPRATSRPLTSLMQFGHDIEIFNWQTQINFQKTLATRWQLTLFENFSSVLQQQARGDIWKDDQMAGLRLQRALRPYWRFETEATSRVFRDDFTRGAAGLNNNDFSLHRFTLRNELTLAQRLRLTPGLGYRWENVLQRQEYRDRRNDDFNLTYGVSRVFEGQATDSLFVRYSHLRRENYFADTTLQVDGLERNRRAIENRLNYRFGGGFLQLRSEIGETEIVGTRRWVEPVTLAGRINGRFQESNFETNHQGLLVFHGGRLSNEIAFDYSSRNRTFEIPDSLRASPFLRRFPREGFDADDWTFGLSHRLHWQIGARDSLRWYGRAVRHAHNTANLENPDDYDRVQFQANVFYEHRFHENLRMRWEARSYLEHQVYLKRNLSVRATYIDYDFPESISRRRSLVFRDFTVIDSLAARFSRRTHMNLYYKLTLEERGALDWERWLQTPQTTVHRHAAVLTFRHELAKNFYVAPSASYYRENNWSFQRRSTAPGYQKVFNYGQGIVTPAIVISYLRPPNTLLILSARRQISRRFRAQGAEAQDVLIDTFHMTIQWAI
ncbi:MAG: hypothetical protein DYG95_29870 [Chlorobi bacterium CHB1]|nr:hypothetical protein [Chlorobi bacterium CHB1]